MKSIYADIDAYNEAQTPDDKEMCDLLRAEFNTAMPEAESKLWHGHPVWFIEGNPIVGYQKQKLHLNVLFWSGQSFEEPRLLPEGSFKAAEAKYTKLDQVDLATLHRWLSKAKAIQWDYKNIVKREGVLERLK